MQGLQMDVEDECFRVKRLRQKEQTKRREEWVSETEGEESETGTAETMRGEEPGTGEEWEEGTAGKLEDEGSKETSEEWEEGAVGKLENEGSEETDEELEDGTADTEGDERVGGRGDEEGKETGKQ